MFISEVSVWLLKVPAIGGYYAEYTLRGQWESSVGRLMVERDFPAWNDDLFALEWQRLPVSKGTCVVEKGTKDSLWLVLTRVDRHGFRANKRLRITFSGSDSLWMAVSPESSGGYWFERTFDE